jgi:hypothetical protein
MFWIDAVAGDRRVADDWRVIVNDVLGDMAKRGELGHVGLASKPVAKCRKASTAFGKTSFGFSLAATQSAAFNAAPFSSRAAASTSTGFRIPSAISRSTVFLVACRQLF